MNKGGVMRLCKSYIQTHYDYIYVLNLLLLVYLMTHLVSQKNQRRNKHVPDANVLPHLCW